MDDSAKGVYDMILRRDLWTEIGLYIKFYEHFIKADDGPLKGSTAPMVDLGTYVFKSFYKGKIIPKKLFMNAYSE